jgi:hypothetical protein
MSAFNYCQLCRGKLEHTAFFCPQCGQSTCSWACHRKHLACHAREKQFADNRLQPPAFDTALGAEHNVRAQLPTDHAG